MAFKAFSGNPVTAGTSPTATAATATSTPCGAFYIEAFQDNTDVVWIGSDSTVLDTSKNGKRLEVPIAGCALPGFSIPGAAQTQGNNLASVYAISATAAQKYNIFYEDQ
jgi:hypothetical protein